MIVSSMLRTRIELLRTPFQWAIVSACLFCGVSVHGAATDSSWLIRWENGLGDLRNEWGTVSVNTIESRPRYVMSGKSLRIDYCLGPECDNQRGNFFLSLIYHGGPDLSGKYNTFCVWVKRDTADNQDRDFRWGIVVMPCHCEYATPVIRMKAGDTAAHFYKIPLVAFVAGAAVTDTSQTLPSGSGVGYTIGFGARDTVMEGKVARPRVPGRGTVWVDNPGLIYDPAFPDFPGPRIPFDPAGPVGTMQGGGHSSRCAPVARERAMSVALSPGRRPAGALMYGLDGRFFPAVSGGKAGGLIDKKHNGVVILRRTGAEMTPAAH